ncbi:MAG: M1 family metallopeptidase [Flavicella sp.]
MSFKSIIKYACVFVFTITTHAQNSNYWQQHADYKMEVDMDVEKFQYTGFQTVTYTNNSPDVLNKVYFHLYNNAFQPGSEMDIRLQNIKDPDPRMTVNLGTEDMPKVTSRISLLKPNEIGFLRVSEILQDGVVLATSEEGTILEVVLNTPIASGASTVFELKFKGQVPEQIRRSGRNNKEGVALSMCQWYPKMVEYDFEGWHTFSYVGREFHGVWGNFDVTIQIDKNYTVGGSGVLQNPEEIGHGYSSRSEDLVNSKSDKLSWHFVADNVHDFTWAADPEFQHDRFKTASGTELHFLYKKNMEPQYLARWMRVQSKTEELLNYFNKHVGPYPYDQYSVIQGGDGGMEYAMCTLITGERSFESLFGVIAHEMAHSWFQFVLASNESKHPWMDEGFTTYISNLAENHILKKGKENPLLSSYSGYFSLLSYGLEEPLTTQGDAYKHNFAYGVASYSKGSIFLAQLEYVIGKENVEKTLLKYYQDFKFKHPTPNDIKRTAEKVSGISLEWYLNYWTQTTHTIDYGVTVENGNEVHLSRIGEMPMPIDLSVVYKDGTSEAIYIPLKMMRGEKPTVAKVLKDWSWVAPNYTFTTEKEIQSIEIDTSKRMADVERENNIWKFTEIAQ